LCFIQQNMCSVPKIQHSPLALAVLLLTSLSNGIFPPHVSRLTMHSKLSQSWYISLVYIFLLPYKKIYTPRHRSSPVSHL
jgi:hypothetical protein